MTNINNYAAIKKTNTTIFSKTQETEAILATSDNINDFQVICEREIGHSSSV